MKRLSRRLRLFIWFAQGYLNKHGRSLFLGFIIGILIFLLTLKIYPNIIAFFRLETKRIAVIGAYTPTNLPPYIQNLISLGLTSLNEAGEASPSLALNWETKEEGKVYIFNLKSDLFWHDGTKFKAADVNYNLKSVTFEPVTDTMLKVTLKEPFTPLPTILNRPLFKKGLVGVGSYKIKRLKLKGDRLHSIVLTSFNGDLPLLEFKFFPTELAAITAFKLGEVDVLDKISQENNFSSWSNTVLASQIYYDYNIILLYNTRSSFLQKRTIRQGLTYAIPDFNEEKSFGPLNPRSWAYNVQVRDYSYNQDQAKSLLKKEGLSTASAELNLITFSPLLAYAQKIATSWEEMGIKTNIRVENSLPSTFDALLLSQEIPADPDQYHLWHSTQSTNISGFANLKIDKLLEDGRRIQDKEKRLQIYQDFQKYLVDEVPGVFLFHPKVYSVERK